MSCAPLARVRGLLLLARVRGLLLSARVRGLLLLARVRGLLLLARVRGLLLSARVRGLLLSTRVRGLLLSARVRGLLLSARVRGLLLSPVKPRKAPKAELCTISENDEEEDDEEEKQGVAQEGDLLLQTQRDILQAEAAAQLIQTDDELKSYHLQLTGYIHYAIEFISLLQSALPMITEMFTSKTQGDVVQALRFIAKAVKFNLGGSSKCLRDSFGLIWHGEESIRNECVQTFVTVYLTSGNGCNLDDEEEGVTLTCAHSRGQVQVSVQFIVRIVCHTNQRGS